MSMKENHLILILGLAGFVVMADNWVVSPILPAIASSIGVSPVQAGLLISAYMIPFGLFQLVFGPLADRYGKRQVITFSMIFFTVGTALCGLGLGLLGPVPLSSYYRRIRSFCHAYFPRSYRRRRAYGKTPTGDRNVYGNFIPWPRTQHGRRRINRLLCELARSLFCLRGIFSSL